MLVSGIKPHCRHLRTLSLSHLANLTPEGFSTLFDLWPLNSGLTHLSVHRCTSLSSSSLRSLLAHSAHSLETLDLHSVDEIEQEDLFQLARDAKHIVELDVSFVRATDNFVVKAFMDGMSDLTTLFVHGNNRITDDCPQKVRTRTRALAGADADFATAEGPLDPRTRGLQARRALRLWHVFLAWFRCKHLLDIIFVLRPSVRKLDEGVVGALLRGSLDHAAAASSTDAAQGGR